MGQECVAWDKTWDKADGVLSFKALIGAENLRDSPWDEPGTEGSKSCPTATSALGQEIPLEWSQALAQLRNALCPEWMDAARWGAVITTAEVFTAKWAPTASRLG